MTTVACVLRSGGDFSPRWVYALRRGLTRHLREYRFVCLTEIASIPPMWVRPFKYYWPGWWSKMELFRPGLFSVGERVLYVDLDTLPVGSLEEIAAYEGEFGMMTGFYKNIPQSGVMAWTPNEISEDLWAKWIKDPQANMGKARGDGEWIGQNIMRPPDRLMDLYPGQMVSLKLHAKDGPPPGARLVLGHGQPRFDDPEAGWAHREWERVSMPRPKAA